MSIRLKCRSCQTAFVIADDQAGGRVTCPKCGVRAGSHPPAAARAQAAAAAARRAAGTVGLCRRRRAAAAGTAPQARPGRPDVARGRGRRRGGRLAVLEALVASDPARPGRGRGRRLPPGPGRRRLRGGPPARDGRRAPRDPVLPRRPPPARGRPRDQGVVRADGGAARPDRREVRVRSRDRPVHAPRTRWDRRPRRSTRSTTPRPRPSRTGSTRRWPAATPTTSSTPPRDWAGPFAKLAEGVLAPKKLIPTYKQLVHDAKPPLPADAAELALDFAAHRETWDALLKRPFPTLKADGPFIFERAEVTATVRDRLASSAIRRRRSA